MAWTARNRPELLDDFLRPHVLTWSGHYLEKLRSVAAHRFFEGLALLADASLEGIREALDLVVDYPRYFR